MVPSVTDRHGLVLWATKWSEVAMSSHYVVVYFYFILLEWVGNRAYIECSNSVLFVSWDPGTKQS